MWKLFSGHTSLWFILIFTSLSSNTKPNCTTLLHTKQNRSKRFSFRNFLLISSKSLPRWPVMSNFTNFTSKTSGHWKISTLGHHHQHSNQSKQKLSWKFSEGMSNHFSLWLGKKLTELGTDDSVFGPYIISILEVRPIITMWKVTCALHPIC